MKNNQSNVPVQFCGDTIATLPTPVLIKNDAAFDKLRYQPAPRAEANPKKQNRLIRTLNKDGQRYAMLIQFSVRNGDMCAT